MMFAPVQVCGKRRPRSPLEEHPGQAETARASPLPPPLVHASTRLAHAPLTVEGDLIYSVY